MRPFLLINLCIVLLHFSATSQTNQWIYPVAPKEPVSDTYFGTVVNDPYRWMENDTLSQTREWIKQENELSEKYLHKLLNKYPIENQLTFNSYFDFASIHKEGKYFVDYAVISAMQKNPYLYLKKNINETLDEPAIDPADYKHTPTDITSLSGYSISKNNKYIAFGISYNGSDWREIYVKTIYPFHKLPDHLKWVKFSSIDWMGDGFFYCTYDSLQRYEVLTAVNQHPKIFYHKLGTLQSEDKLVFYDPSFPTNNIRFSVMGDERYLVINHDFPYKGKVLNKVSFIDFAKDSTTVTDLILSANHYGVVGMYKGKFLVKTYFPTAHGSLLLVSPDDPGQLEEFIPEHKEILQQVSVIGNKVLCTYLDDIDNIFITYNANGEAVNKITFPVGSSVDGFEGTPHDSVTQFFYHSFLYPAIVYSYNVNTLKEELVQRPAIDYNSNDFEVRKVYYYSKDGQKIPMIIAGPKGFELNGKNPAILYGYGGYGISMTPFFDKGFINHLQNGGLVAVPCLRGGGEYGAEWHQQGAMLHKQNVFDDFIAAAEYLKNQHYTCKEKLAIMGGSNGGLLIGAVINQRPDLCQAAVARMGLFDMLRYQKYTIGYAWEGEFGTSADSVQFRYLYKYSPLHNVGAHTVYPATLIVTADHDDRVVPMHSYKFLATLQDKNKSDAPILLLTEKNRGHYGGDKKIEGSIYSFIYEQLKINPASIRD